jgi:NhaP-type Na+/H+ or K+/H+ antiporter
MGLIVGNMKFLHLVQHDKHAVLLEGFVGQISEMSVFLVFVTLGINMPFAALNEMVFLSWCRETAVIPAALAALLLDEGVPGADIEVSMVALAVCVTLLLQATTAGRSPRPLPRRGRRKLAFFAVRLARI